MAAEAQRGNNTESLPPGAVPDRFARRPHLQARAVRDVYARVFYELQQCL